MRRDIFAAEHEDFRLLIRDFVAREVVPHHADWERAGELPREFFRKLGDIGVMGMAIPAEYGGSGNTDYRYNVVLQEEAQDTAELSFTDVRVPVANRLGEEGAAFGYLGRNLPQERMTIAVGSVSQARAALDATVSYVSSRRVFGKALGSFQNTKFELAAVAAEVEAGQALLDRALLALVDGELSGADAAVAKLFCTEMQARAVDRCLQLFGGYGYVTEYPIARLYADARVTRIYGGTSEVMKSIISKSLGLLPRRLCLHVVSVCEGISVRIAGISALVTGGASGLGLGTARHLVQRGARVVLLDLPGSAGESVAGELGAVFVAGDVTDTAGIEAALDAAAERGPLRAVVHCAGRGGDRFRIIDKDRNPGPLDAFAEVVRVNLTGTYNVLRLAAARMSGNDPLGDERGAIVLTASVAAFEGQIGQTSYAASKSGVRGITIVAARDLASWGIRVNTIAPGIMDTPMLARLRDDIRAGLAASVPYPKRLGTPADYAQLAASIIENPYLNGEVIRLDGAIRMAPR